MGDQPPSGLSWSTSRRWAAWPVGLVIVAACVLGAARSAGATGARAGSRAGSFVYVAATKRNEISQFKVTGSGALKALKPAAVHAGAFPYGIAASPEGTSVYAVDVGPDGHPANRISEFTANPVTGRLTPKSPAKVVTGPGPESIAISPNGNSAYVGDQDTVSQYNINPTTGRLTPKSPLTVAAIANTAAIAVAYNGKYAYVATCGACTTKLRRSSSGPIAGPASADGGSQKPSYLLEYQINPSTGALSRDPIAKVTTGLGANWLAIAPNDRSAYVATSTNGGSVWQYTINPTTGKLTPKTPESVTTGGDTHNVVLGPNGRTAYVIGVSSNKVAEYRIDRSTGALGSHPLSSAATVLHPEAIAITANGKNAYVTSENNPEMSQYRIDPTTGRITPLKPATVKTASGALGVAVTPTN